MRIVNGLTHIGQSGLSLVVLAGLLLLLHWTIAVVLLAAAIPGTLLRLKYSQQLYMWQRKSTPAERQSWYYQLLLTGVEYAKEIRLLIWARCLSNDTVPCARFYASKNRSLLAARSCRAIQSMRQHAGHIRRTRLHGLSSHARSNHARRSGDVLSGLPTGASLSGRDFEWPGQHVRG